MLEIKYRCLGHDKYTYNPIFGVYIKNNRIPEQTIIWRRLTIEKHEFDTQAIGLFS